MAKRRERGSVASGVIRCGWCGEVHAGECEAEREAMAMIAGAIAVKVAVIEATGGKRGVQGSVPCPVCASGTVRYSVASCNGHVWAACSTKGCVRFME